MEEKVEAKTQVKPEKKTKTRIKMMETYEKSKNHKNTEKK